jgi:hypothetical protein
LSLRAVDDILLESAASSRSNLFNGTCSMVGEWTYNFNSQPPSGFPIISYPYVDHRRPRLKLGLPPHIFGLFHRISSNFIIEFHPHNNPITNRYPFIIVRPTAVLIEHVLERRGRKKTDRGFTTMCRHAGCRKRG